MDDDSKSSSGRKLRLAFTESNIFRQIPKNNGSKYSRSSSMPKGNRSPTESSKNSFEDPGKLNSWRSSLETTFARPLKNSFTLGFLFPDDEDDDDLHQSFLSDNNDDDEEEKEEPPVSPFQPLEGIDESNAVEFGETKVNFTPRVTMHRAQTAPAMSSLHREQMLSASLQRPSFPKGSAIVTQAGIGLMIYLLFGVAIYIWKSQEFSGIETFSIVDALYFSVVTMCTIGYGDIVPITPFAKLFSCVFVLLGFGFIDALLSGMVTYVLDKQEQLLLSAVEGSHFRTAKKYFLNAKHGNRMRIRMKVAMALGVPVVCIVTGTYVMMKLEDLVLLDAFYCTIMSITTVGYGDHTFKSYSGRLFAAVWLLVSTLAVARCFLYLAEARVDKRHRLIAKWVLQRELTVGDLVQADLDHDGCISKAEFVVYKLREMGLIQSHEIADICHQFEHMDTNNSGKITLARLQEGN